ncbi:kinesin-like protein costa [Culicoides brevitarsis]|uniref:kinesin-like protein costa n=1 Tax=Culicoides brevitarsis TaxID=469753 RepID=UPI00307C896F
METSVVAAVRVQRNDNNNEVSAVHTVQYPTTDNYAETNNMILAGVQVAGKTFPCSFAFPEESDQEDVYCRMLAAYMPSFLEGFDVSIVSYGQKNTGKSYTIYGPGLDCLYNEADYGLCQRFIRELFHHLMKRSERTYQISISWTEITEEDEQVIDLLNNLGLVQCKSVKECFDWIQLGMATRNGDNHNIFTLILEQQWITADGVNQHKLSTLSFCDLSASDRRFVPNELNQNISVPRNFSLQALEQFILSLTDPTFVTDNIYNQSALPALLKDSFGGRAQTVFLLCVSPTEEDIVETTFNLEFMTKVQMVLNFVYMNAYTDNNVPIDNLYQPSLSENDFRNNNENVTESQQFAMNQWMKLLQNAEGLFNRIIHTSNVEGLKPEEMQQIEEWLYLKAECDECINVNEMEDVPQETRSLGPIEEIDECEEENVGGNTSEIDSDSEVCQKMGDIDDVIEKLIVKFQSETDNLVEEGYRDYLKSHPQSTLDSCDSFKADKQIIVEPNYSRQRRRSLQPGSEISNSHLAMLNSLTKSSSDERPKHKSKSHASVENNLKNCQTNIEALKNQISEVEQTIKLKEKLISELTKNKDTRTTAKNRFNKKKAKLEAEYEKAKKQLARAVTSSKHKSEIDRLKLETTQLEIKLRDMTSMQSIASESTQKIKKVKQSLHESKVDYERLQKNLKAEKKMHDTLEKELENKHGKDTKSGYMTVSDGKNKIRNINDRIQNLDLILKAKNENLKQVDSDQADSLRHEIGNLRKTKEHLMKQRCLLDEKLKRQKSLSYDEERKRLECGEAIEAIDVAIELKNESICGRKSVDIDESIQREKGEQLLISRLNRLSNDEMRTLLYKYFQKVIDLKESSRNLEIQLIELERQREQWIWQEKQLKHTIRQARFEGEKNIILLQRQHETKLNLMLKHFANESCASSSYSTINNDVVPMPQHGELDLYDPRRQYVDDSMEMFKHPAIKHHKPEAIAHFSSSKYKPLEKMKEKERESKNKFLAKFQVLTRYQSSSEKKKLASQQGMISSVIPQQNLKQLNNTCNTLPNSTKVTRQKNKLIIQQQDNS